MCVLVLFGLMSIFFACCCDGFHIILLVSLYMSHASITKKFYFVINLLLNNFRSGSVCFGDESSVKIELLIA